MNKPLPLLLLPVLLLSACGDDGALFSTDPYQEYEEENVTVINGNETVPIASGETTGDNCLQLTEEDCVPVVREGKYCKTDTGPVDVIVADGMVVETVCYEDTTGDGQGPVVVIDENQDGDFELPQQDNGAVITFDESTNGEPIEGDVTVDGNNVTLYGNGPENTIIDGDLRIDGNNARVRGVRVTGNVIIDKNTAAILFSTIEGNLVLVYNNSLAAENKVFGNIEIKGNNIIAIRNGVAGNLQNDGSGTVCDENYAFSDANEDGTVQEEEKGEILSCN